MANTTMICQREREREREKKINKQTILLHQSAQIEYSKNGFLIIRPPKMYRKDHFSPEQWAELEKVLSHHSALVRCVAFDASGKLLASGSNDKTIIIYNKNFIFLVETVLQLFCINKISFFYKLNQ